MYDDDDDGIPGAKPQERTKEEKDRENAEMFRKAAEEDGESGVLDLSVLLGRHADFNVAKRAEAAKQAKKGWLGGWFGGGGGGGGGAAAKKDAPAQQLPNKPVKANLGEASNFVYDKELKRWVNKKAGAEAPEVKTATPPPPRSMPPRATTVHPAPQSSASAGMAPPPGPPGGPGATGGRASAPPGGPAPPLGGASPAMTPSSSSQGAVPRPGLAPPIMARSASSTSATGPPSAPPSRPATSMSNASSIDDLLSGAGPRKPGAKKGKKGGRYVDVMAK
jgi:hypothetical protein